MTIQPTLFLPHGGGPCFFMDWTWGSADTWHPLANFLRSLPAALPERPRAIVLISGHWEEACFTVNIGSRPPLLFDYYGFPDHTYDLQYSAPGSPEIAQQVAELITSAGLPVAATEKRGFDHGVFIPLKVSFPEADIPIVQVSLNRSLDPASHLALGQALSPLRHEGILIIGSGMSWHNLRLYGREETFALSEAFDRWLNSAVEQSSPAVRNHLLSNWQMAPQARIAHPREEHLVPLFVAAGAGIEDQGHCIFRDAPMQAAISAYRFG